MSVFQGVKVKVIVHYVVERIKCTIHDWCILHNPLHQFGNANKFNLGIVVKIKNVL